MCRKRYHDFMKKKILLFDIETSPHLSYTWGKYEQDVIDFKEEGHIMCFAYKFLDEKKIYTVATIDFKKDGERMVVENLHRLFDTADIIIAHNGDDFDIKMVNRSFARYGMQPPSPYETIDTKKLAKSRFRFTSNKLDDLGEYLGLGRKIQTGGFQLWLDCMAGNKKAWKKMLAYNKQDVALLEKIYLRLRPWAKTHPRIDTTDKILCPVCGSHKVQRRGYGYTASGFMYYRFQCNSCGKYSIGKHIKRIINSENIIK